MTTVQPAYMGWGHRMPAHQIMPPFPYFGGKRNAAERVWNALGDVGGYVEPFAGSAAVLLGRPPFKGRRYETINDLDGWLVNAWRAMKHDPATVAKYAVDPVSEIDYHARAAWLQQRRTPDLISWLEGDPECYDAKAAGWWLYVAACSIGTGPLTGGPWHVVDDHLVKTERSDNGITRAIPHIAGHHQGILRRQPEHYGATDLERVETYLRLIQKRLSRVRITVGDWKRVMNPFSLKLTSGPNIAGVFLDPPYTTGSDVYSEVDADASHEALDWCLAAPDRLRVVLAGYDDDNDELLTRGWRKENSIGGQGSGRAADPLNGRRERLWFSPACLNNDDALFTWGGGTA